MHENVTHFPEDYLDQLGRDYGSESAIVTPQRFGKPMNRPGIFGRILNIHEGDLAMVSFFYTYRLRKYHLKYNKKKYAWKGPTMRQILKLTCPLQPLKLNAHDMFFRAIKKLLLGMPRNKFCFSCQRLVKVVPSDMFELIRLSNVAH